MQKPYAESTLRKKYRETAIDHSLIDLVKDYLNACAFFYYILEIDEVWKIIQKGPLLQKSSSTHCSPSCAGMIHWNV